MFLPLLSLCFVLSATVLGAPGSRATDDPWDQVDGLYAGHPIGKPGTRVTIEMRGPSLIIMDPDAILVMRVERWEIAGPGGKLGDLQWKSKATAQGAIARDGKSKGAPRNPESQVRLRWFPEHKKAVLCATRPGDKATIERVPPPGAGDATGAGITCWDLVRVWSPSAPDPGLPAPDFECMRECRQANMMRAVGPNVIEEDCRKECTRP